MIIGLILGVYGVVCLLIGIFVGYALSRKQQDRSIVNTTARVVEVEEKLLDDPYRRAMLTYEEIEEIESGNVRIETINV
jgi:hypothetical protein